MNSFVASTAFSILSFRASITFNMRILNHRLTRKSTLYFIFFFFFLSDNETQSQRGGAPRGLQNKVFFVNYSFTILQLETIHLARACLMACSLSTLPREFPWLTALHQPKVPWPWPSFSLSLYLSWFCLFYSHSQHMKFSRLCHSSASSWSMWCCSPHPQHVQATSSVLDSKTSSQVMFISLITGNSIAQSQKIATLYFTFFYFF